MNGKSKNGHVDPPTESSTSAPATGTGTGTPWTVYVRRLAMALMVGIGFGIVLVKSEVVRWQRIHDMFMFREPNLYLIMGTAIVVGLVSMQWIKRRGARSIDGERIVYKPKPFQKGIIFGGMIFGAGWAITGACPGPIYAQIGGGSWMSLFTLAGALIGMFLYAIWQPRLPH